MLGGPYVALSALDPLHGPLVKNRCNKTSMNLPMCCSRGKFLPWPWRDRQWQPRSRASACWCCRCSPQRTVVNFIINLQAAFALIFFCKKIQSQTVIREKLGRLLAEGSKTVAGNVQCTHLTDQKKKQSQEYFQFFSVNFEFSFLRNWVHF